MTTRVWANRYTDAEATSLGKFQMFTPPKNAVLEAVRTSLVFYNSPTMTSVKAQIYSDAAGTPDELIAESDVRTAASIAVANGIVETWFEFSPVVNLTGGYRYHVVLYFTGYSGNSASSHVAWVVDWPDRSVSGATAPTTKSLGVNPYKVNFFTAAFQ